MICDSQEAVRRIGQGEGWTNPGIMGPKAPMRSVPGALIQKDILKRRSCLLLYKTSSAHRELAVFTRSPEKTG